MAVYTKVLLPDVDCWFIEAITLLVICSWEAEDYLEFLVKFFEELASKL